MKHGFVLQDHENKKYRLGPAVLRLRASFLAQNDLRSYARSYLEELSTELNETVYLTVLQNESAICGYLWCCRNLKYFVEIGRKCLLIQQPRQK